MKKTFSLIKSFFVFMDFSFFFISLIFLLYFRFGSNVLLELKYHFLPFLFIFPFYLLFLFSFNFYDFYLLNFKELFYKVINFFIVALIFSSLYFYFGSTFFKISPKTNLFIFILFFIFYLIFSRIIVIKIFKKNLINVYFVGEKNLEEKLKKDLEDNQFFSFKGIFKTDSFEYLPQNSILILDSNYELDRNFFEFLKKYPVTTFDYISFYERFLGRLPLEALSVTWLIKEVIQPENKIYFYLKRLIDIILGFFTLIIFILLLPFIALLIYINSPGPIFFIQERVGYKGKIFKLIKFRTMKLGKDPKSWAVGKEKERIFFVGKILRATHLDELPQVINILKGDLSFVGPRPEQPEIAENLNKQILFYELRTLIKPGLTGWAQVNYKYPENIEETKIKLEYDLYYLKNSSIVLDLLILIKTFQKFLGR